MDSRLKLTKRQKTLVNRLKKTFEELKKENVGIIESIDEDWFLGYASSFLFFNKANVISMELTEDQEEDYLNDDETVWYTPSNLEEWVPGVDKVVNEETWFSVELPNDEETAVMMAQLEVEKEVKRLMAKSKKLRDDLDRQNTEIQRYEDAIAEGKNNIAHFKKSEENNEIVEEEKALLSQNKTQVAALKKELAKLKNKISKLDLEIKAKKAEMRK